MKIDIARRTFNLFSFAGKVIELLSVDLNRRIHGRQLLLRAREAGKACLYFVSRRTHRRGADGFACGILRVGRKAERKPRNVFLVLRGGKISRFGCAADKHRQHAGCHRVQRTAVTNAACMQDAAQLCHYIVRGKTLRLIHQQNAV